MKILLTSHAFLPKSFLGTETYTHDLAKVLQNMGHQVSVLYPDSIIAGDSAKITCCNDFFDEIPVHILSYNILYTENFVRAEYYNEEVEKFLLEFLKDFSPDIVHSVHSGHLSTAVVTACKKLHIPILYTATDFWLICPTSQLLRYDLSLCKGPFNAGDCLLCYYSSRNPLWGEYGNRLKKMPRILRNFFLNAAAFRSDDGSIEKKAIKAISKRRKWMIQIISSLDLFIAPSQFLLNMFIKNGLNPKKAVYLPYGRDLKWTESLGPREKKDLLHFGYIGVIAPWKGIDVLIKAFNHMCQGREVYLKIYGDINFMPDYTNKLMELSKGNDKISFQGVSSKDEIGKVMNSIDVLVVPSIWYENTPFVIQEALAAKVPVIATNLGGMSEIVKHAFNGLLFEKENFTDLAIQMIKVVENPPLLERLRNNARPIMTIQDNGAELVKIYSALAKAGERS